MNEDKSSIDSFNISLGKSAAGRSGSSNKQLEPWDVLVCSDLGFTSVVPQQVKISEWNEFMAAQNIVIAGSMENMLLPGAGPVFTDYPVSSMKDFFREAIQVKLNVFSGYTGLLDALTQLLQGKCAAKDVLAALQKAPLVPVEQKRVMALFGLSGSAAQSAPPPAAGNKAALASILSMVDVGEAEQEPKEQRQSPTPAIDSLLESLTDGGGPVLDKKACNAYIEAGGKTLRSQLSAYCSQPFFSRRKASWQCLMQCAKAIGRKKEIRLSVLSAPAEDVDGLIEKLSSEFISPDASPDVIVWDYPVSFTNADIDRVSRLMDTADRWKSAVIAPLASQDAIFAGLDNKNDFAPLFQDVRYLHYKKLRSKLETRALCLCGPDMKLPDASEALNGAQGAFPASCCWPVMIRWIDRSAGNDDPFSLGSYSLAPETMLPDKAKFEFRISKAMSEEAAAIAGLTLFDGNPVGATPDRVRTVIEPEVAGHAYTSFLFNLLVNRVARLAGRRIGLFANAMNNQELAANVEALLRRELCAYNVCASLDQVSIKTEENGALAITLNSDEKVGGFPARFSFTLETQVTG